MPRSERSGERGTTSIGMIEWPRDSSSRLVCEPMKPLAPVIRTLHCIVALIESAFADEEPTHQTFPVIDFFLVFLRCVFAFDVNFLELLLERTNVLARRADSAFHSDLLTKFRMKIIKKKKSSIRTG